MYGEVRDKTFIGGQNEKELYKNNNCSIVANINNYYTCKCNGH